MRRGGRVAPALLAFLAAGPAGAQSDLHHLGVFLTAMGEIQTRYVDESRIDAATLLKNAEDGVLSALDAESLLLEPIPDPGPAGLGMRVRMRGGVAWILDVAEGGPADLAGIRAGDRLLRVDGEPVHEKKRPEVTRTLKGKPGSRAWILWIDREGNYREKAIKRAVVAQEPWRMSRVDGILVLEVFRLDAASVEELKGALLAAQEGGEPGVLMDLRRCVGGDLDAALSLADACFPGGELLAIGQRAGVTGMRQYVAGKKSSSIRLPLVLVTGFGTQGAAELLASAFKEHRRGVVVGESTFGYVARQKEFLVGGAKELRVRLTVERFLSASTVSLTGTGVGADLSVHEPPDTNAARKLRRFNVAELMADHLLERAPSAFDAAALDRGELRLKPELLEGRSVVEQRGEFAQAFVIALEALLRDLNLDLSTEEVTRERHSMISKVRVHLARRRMAPVDARLVELREDSEIALGADVLRTFARRQREKG